MARLILFVFLLFLLLTVLRGLRIFFTAVFRPPAPPRGSARPGGTLEGEMVRDPICGTWIDRRLALTGRKEGQTVAVCSEKCRQALEAAS
jgi:hypothetical protein